MYIECAWITNRKKNIAKGLLYISIIRMGFIAIHKFRERKKQPFPKKKNTHTNIGT